MPQSTDTTTPTNTPSLTATVTMAVVTSQYGLNMRAQPDENSNLLTFLPTETVVILLPKQEQDEIGRFWQQVEYQDFIGWVLAEFLEQSAE
jgi:hypothetical protein